MAQLFPPPAAVGSSVQVGVIVTGAVSTGTTIIPVDDTIPQITEGDQVMSLVFTPKNANNRLLIGVVAFCASSVAGDSLAVALFQDAIADAIAVGVYQVDSADNMGEAAFQHSMIAGTTAAITFRVRIGGNNAATRTFNGHLGVRRYGGRMASSIRVTEIVV